MIGFVHISQGGPTLKISVGGKILTFEFHPHIGPVLLKRNGDACKDQPTSFLHAASLWVQQGKRLDADGLCIWDHAPEMITRPLCPGHVEFVGMKPPRKGE